VNDHSRYLKAVFPNTRWLGLIEAPRAFAGFEIAAAHYTGACIRIPGKRGDDHHPNTLLACLLALGVGDCHRCGLAFAANRRGPIRRVRDALGVDASAHSARSRAELK
jgi:hypothetical protein